MKRQELEEKQLASDTIPSKLVEVNAELQELTAKYEARAGPPPPPGPGRDMTFEEKRRLSHALGQLPGERLARVLEIIAEGPSAPQLVGRGREGACGHCCYACIRSRGLSHHSRPGPQENEEEYELDIDALDSDTLWKLQSYVDSVLGELAAKAPGGAPAGGGTAPAGAAPAVAGGAQQQQGFKAEQPDGEQCARRQL